MGQDVSPALGVVHQSLDTPYNGCVDAALRGLIVHALQEVQQTAQAIQLNKPGHKPEKKKPNNQKTSWKNKESRAKALYSKDTILFNPRSLKAGKF